jgi:hypothetical protein
MNLIRLKSLFQKFLKTSLSAILFLFLIGLFFYFFFRLNDYFTIKKIEIVSRDKLAVKGLESFKNKGFFFISEAEIVKKLIDINPRLANIEVEKKLPDSLVIKVEKNRQFAVLSVSNGFFILDEKGKIINKIKDNTTNLPLINFYQKLDYFTYNSGQSVGYKDITSSLLYIKRATDLGLNIVTIDINGDHMVGLKLKDRQIVFSLEKDIQSQIYQLEAVIKNFKIQGKNFKKLDFRFEKPIVELN